MKILKSQSIIEYTMLLIIVSAALYAMSTHISRALQVRQRHLAQELNETNR